MYLCATLIGFKNAVLDVSQRGYLHAYQKPKRLFSGILRMGVAGDVVFASGSLLKAIAMGIFGYGEIISDLGAQ
jgi:hypothetical protein